MSEKKNDSSDMLKAYAIFSQGIVSMIVLGAIGFFIGWKIDKHGPYSGIFAVIGAMMGLVYFILLVYKNHYFDSKPKEKSNDTERGEDSEK